ncbi:DUF2061 domain-containing protein [Hyunsoonleella aestuarii]|uniref:DUF2061 domain-containing protein n=1 Tax=Hyunsoonleella aestuarii TaxID=912802 RepID=A0ABP8E707_9FLAO|nr:DUF2061 domain-containing protein [Hyunsoonleella aestuarii]
MTDKSHKRHIAKAITWRIVGTIDTILLSWLISGNPFVGLQIGALEVITKLLLYYIHERIWFKSHVKEKNKRHLFKTVTWRVVGTIDTVLVAWVITGNPITGLSIGFVEVITKMILYYLHERGWYKLNYGIEQRRKNKSHEN